MDITMDLTYENLSDNTSSNRLSTSSLSGSSLTNKSSRKSRNCSSCNKKIRKKKTFRQNAVEIEPTEPKLPDGGSQITLTPELNPWTGTNLGFDNYPTSRSSNSNNDHNYYNNNNNNNNNNNTSVSSVPGSPALSTSTTSNTPSSPVPNNNLCRRCKSKQHYQESSQLSLNNSVSNNSNSSYNIHTTSSSISTGGATSCSHNGSHNLSSSNSISNNSSCNNNNYNNINSNSNSNSNGNNSTGINNSKRDSGIFMIIKTITKFFDSKSSSKSPSIKSKVQDRTENGGSLSSTKKNNHHTCSVGSPCSDRKRSSGSGTGGCASTSSGGSHKATTASSLSGYFGTDQITGESGGSMVTSGTSSRPSSRSSLDTLSASTTAGTGLLGNYYNFSDVLDNEGFEDMMMNRMGRNEQFYRYKIDHNNNHHSNTSNNSNTIHINGNNNNNNNNNSSSNNYNNSNISNNDLEYDYMNNYFHNNSKRSSIKSVFPQVDYERLNRRNPRYIAASSHACLLPTYSCPSKSKSLSSQFSRTNQTRLFCSSWPPPGYQSNGQPFDITDENGFLGEEHGLSLEQTDKNSRSLYEFNIPYADIRLGDLLKSGPRKKIYKGHWHGDVTIFMFENLNHEERNNFWVKVSSLTMIRHENIVLFMGASVEPPNFLMVTSACNGPSLYEKIHMSREKMRQSFKVNLMRQIAQAVGYLHAKNKPVIVRRLNSRNIYLDPKVVLSLLDYSFLDQDDIEVQDNVLLPTHLVWYTAPELLNQYNDEFPISVSHSSFVQSTDVYSFGTLLYEIHMGRYPCAKSETKVFIKDVCNGKRPDVKEIRASNTVKSIIRECWSHDPLARPEFSDISRELMKRNAARKRHSTSVPHLNHKSSSICYNF